MKDLTLKDLKPITKGDKLLKQLLDEKMYSDSIEQKLADVLTSMYEEERN